MGEVINAGAALERIEADAREAEKNARERKGDVAAAAAERLAPPIAVLDAATAILSGAQTAQAAGWRVVLARDEAADVTIGSVRDEMWNGLGRPRQHAAMEHVFPGGVRTYTSGDPEGQPVLMQVLKTRIPTAEASQWTPALREGWIARIEASRAPFAEAVEAHRPLEAALTVAQAGYRAAVRSAHARLAGFKRDLKNLGLTETQIHTIIPDRSDDGERRPRGGGDPTPPA